MCSSWEGSSLTHKKLTRLDGPFHGQKLYLVYDEHCESKTFYIIKGKYFYIKENFNFEESKRINLLLGPIL
jgi:hypothetical protein